MTEPSLLQGEERGGSDAFAIVTDERRRPCGKPAAKSGRRCAVALTIAGRKDTPSGRARCFARRYCSDCHAKPTHRRLTVIHFTFALFELAGEVVNAMLWSALTPLAILASLTGAVILVRRQYGAEFSPAGDL